MSPITDSIVVPGSPRELHHLNAFLGAFWERHALPPGDAMRVELGLEEVFINVVTHGLIGADPDTARVTVDLRLLDGRLELAIEDPGPPFDPLHGTPPADTTSGMEARHLGGLGIHLVRKLLDDVRYERRGDHNRLTMTARLGHPHPHAHADGG